MKIYIARHGKDEEDFRGGWSNRGLINTGKMQVRMLATYLLNNIQTYNINTILSSDLTRAKETAKPISEKLGININYTEALREMNNGDLAGLKNEIADKKYAGLYFNSLGMDERYPNGESPNEFFYRISGFLEKLVSDVKENKIESNVLLITHGGVVNIIYYILKKLEWSNKVKKFPCYYTSLHCIEYDGATWKIVVENSNKHIEKY